MKLFLLLEHRFSRVGKDVFCERVVDYNFLSRYLSVFDEIHVCARFSNQSENFTKKLKASGKGITFVELPDFNNVKQMGFKAVEIRNIVKDNAKNCDAILLRAPSHMSLMTYTVLKKLNKPLAVEFVVNPRTAFQNEINHMSAEKIKSILIQKIMVSHAKKLCLNANGVAYVTKDILQKEYPNRSRLKGQTEQYFESSYSTIDLKEEDFHFKKNDMKSKADLFTISHTGYMDGYVKGHIELMKTIKILIDKKYNVELNFIGTGKLIEEFKEYAHSLNISSNVNFLGHAKGYRDVQRRLLNSDIFVFPSKSEGLPRSLIEAMANSLPCISSPVDGIPELLKDDLLVPNDSPEKIADAIIKLIDNHEYRNKVRQMNYDKALEYVAPKLKKKRTLFYERLYRLAEINQNERKNK